MIIPSSWVKAHPENLTWNHVGNGSAVRMQLVRSRSRAISHRQNDSDEHPEQNDDRELQALGADLESSRVSQACGGDGHARCGVEGGGGGTETWVPLTRE